MMRRAITTAGSPSNARIVTSCALHISQTRYFHSKGSKLPSTPRLTLPSRQSHLRLEDTLFPKQRDDERPETTEELALKHNAYNLVMKLLYGKISEPSALADVHRVLGLPPSQIEAKGKAKRKVSPLDQLASHSGSFTSIEDAGVFARDFMNKQKEIWHAYDVAMTKLRLSQGDTSVAAISKAQNVNELLNVAEGAIDAAQSPTGSFIAPPSDILARLYAKRSARSHTLFDALGDSSSDGQTLNSNAVASCAKDRIVELLTPAPIYRHGSMGCRASEYVSFWDMLTHHGSYYINDGAKGTEDLYIASLLASTKSKTLSASRLSTMRQQFQKSLPSVRYLYAPPGMLVRGYAAAKSQSDGKRVIVLEPETSWRERCYTDIINFERFCLAKVSSLTLGLSSSKKLKAMNSSPDRVFIMDLFLEYRGLPTGAVDRSLATWALRGPQSVADTVTTLYHHALTGSLATLPTVANARATPIAELDTVISSSVSPPLGSRLGLANSTETKAVDDAEVQHLMKAYRQQVILLRRYANAYSPSLAQTAETTADRAIAVSEGDDSANLAASAALAARRSGMHAYDAVALVRKNQKNRAEKKTQQPNRSK